MIGIYLSGTGNTKHCVEKLVSLLDKAAITLPLEAESALGEVGDQVIEQCRFETYCQESPRF